MRRIVVAVLAAIALCLAGGCSESGIAGTHYLSDASSSDTKAIMAKEPGKSLAEAKPGYTLVAVEMFHNGFNNNDRSMDPVTGYVFGTCAKDQSPNKCRKTRYSRASTAMPLVIADAEGNFETLVGPEVSEDNSERYHLTVPTDFRQFASLDPAQQSQLLEAMAEAVAEYDLHNTERQRLTLVIGETEVWTGTVYS